MRGSSKFSAHLLRSWIAGLFVLAAVGCGGSARATTIDVTDVSVPLRAGGLSVTNGANSFSNVIAGQILLTASVSGGLAGPFVLYAWCVDLYHGIYLGHNSYAYTLAGGTVTDDSNGTALSPSVSSKLMTLAAYGNAQLAGAKAGDANFSSAVQLAIWQTEYSGLTFSANATVTGYVANLRAYADTNTAAAASIRSLSGAQNLITDSIGLSFTGNAQPNAVPEPAPMALIGLAGLALALVRRRRAA